MSTKSVKNEVGQSVYGRHAHNDQQDPEKAVDGDVFTKQEIERPYKYKL